MSVKKRYLLLDLNGTVHVGDDPTPGALEALKRLRAESREGGFQFRFCSEYRQCNTAPTELTICSTLRLPSGNSSKEASSSLAARLRKMGFDEEVIPASDLTTSLDACAELCKARQHRPLLMLNPSAQSVFPDSSSFKPDPKRSPKDLSPDEWEQLKSCDAVVVGLAPDLMRHEWLDEAFRLLSGEYGSKAQLIGTHRALYLRPAADPSGNPSPLSLGPGAFLAALEASSGCDADQTVIVGKPQQEFFAQCLRQMGWDGRESAEAWIVSDTCQLREQIIS